MKKNPFEEIENLTQEEYDAYVERKLDEADAFAEAFDVTYSADEVFSRVKQRIEARH